AEGAAQVAAEEPERRRLLPRPAGRLDHGTSLGVGAYHDPVLGQWTDLAPGLPPPNRHGFVASAAPPVTPSGPPGPPTTELAATTPRSRSSAAVRAVRAVAGSGAMSPAWRSRSRSCLALRTKSPPDSSSSSSASSSRSPAA